MDVRVVKTDHMGRITWYANSRAGLEPRVRSQNGRLARTPGRRLVPGQGICANGAKHAEVKPERDSADESGVTPTGVILVPVDFSPASLDAVRVGVSMSRHAGAKLVLCHAILPRVVPFGPASPPWVEKALREEALTEMEPALKLANEAGVTVASVIEDGSPAQAILRVAQRLDADLIILAPREHGRWSRLFSGPTTVERILRDAESHVMILRTSPN